MKQSVLLAWIGNTDLAGMEGKAGAGKGPIGQAVAARHYDRIELLCNYDRTRADNYQTWLQRQSSSNIRLHHCKLTSPINFREICTAALRVLESLRKEQGSNVDLTYHLSPGTPAMASVWILLAKTSYAGRLIQSSAESGVQEADVPFDIAAEFLPEARRVSDERIAEAADGRAQQVAGFDDIVCRSPEMRQVIQMAAKVAVRSVPVLIEGESGTGKEMLARAIHHASPRGAHPFVAVNCGAIPSELVESEFFGHKKGSFTGAFDSRKGHFEHADGGTLFLDEIGELPKPAQVKLLRVLQEGEVTPVGESKARKVNVRVIAATNRSLTEEIAAGRFRDDLFYRLAVAVLKIPPLRNRTGDLNLLIDTLLEQVNRAASQEPGHAHKKVSVKARKLMLEHSWPGNVRELLNTLVRATVWADGEQITPEIMRSAIMNSDQAHAQGGILNLPLGDGLNLEAIIATVARHYLERALKETGGNKTRAAKLVGFSNYQTYSNWMKKYGLKN